MQMIWKVLSTTALALAVGCASASKPENSIVVTVGADGKMRVVSAGDTAEDQALAALMQSALNGDFGLDDAQEPEPLPENQIWRADADGNLTHIQSGAQCPQRWGDYVRGRTSIFRPDGTDVGCNYENADGAVMTFYVYDSPEDLAIELEETFATMKTRQPVSSEVQFADAALPAAYAARTLAFAAADGTRMRTSVLMTDSGPWRLKVRLTCKAGDARRTEQAAGIALMGQADRLAAPQPVQPAEKPSPV
jgi:hypothetical protein